jgi:hypothetical protein
MTGKINIQQGISTDIALQFSKIDVNYKFNYTINKILETEKETNIDVMNWDECEIMVYLKSFKAESPVTLNHKMNILRKFGKFKATVNDLQMRNFKLLDNMLVDCIDLNGLLSVTINPDEYETIRKQLVLKNETGIFELKPGQQYNVRDVLLFELAWQGLTNEDIRELKIKYIDFQKDTNGKEIVLLNYPDKSIRIEDKQLVQDIKKVIDERIYVVHYQDQPYKLIQYRDSDYLIKPVALGPISKIPYVRNPDLTLKNILNRAYNPVKCPEIDVDNLNIEDIRRSKFAYILTLSDDYDLDLIATLYNLKSTSSLYWIRYLASKKYKVNIDMIS